MAKHYICTGDCGAESSSPGSCEDESCFMYNMDFSECGCEDGHHDQLFSDEEDKNWDDLNGDDEDYEDVDDELSEWEGEIDEDEED